MEFTEVIKRRKTVRAFTGEPLAPGTADRLLKAAERAPTASHGYRVAECGNAKPVCWPTSVPCDHHVGIDDVRCSAGGKQPVGAAAAMGRLRPESHCASLFAAIIAAKHALD
jgi:nitroreductase